MIPFRDQRHKHACNEGRANRPGEPRIGGASPHLLISLKGKWYEPPLMVRHRHRDPGALQVACQCIWHGSGLA